MAAWPTAAPLVLRQTSNATKTKTSIVRLRELKAASTTTGNRATVVVYHRHGLTAAMTASPNVSGAKSQALRRRSLGGTRTRLVVGARGVLRGVVVTTRTWTGELETRSRSLLLSKFCSLLRLGKSQRVTALMATARRTPAATVTPTTTFVLLSTLLWLVKIRVPRSTRGWGWRGTHAQTREGGLVAAMGGLGLGLSIHRHAQLLLLLLLLSQLRELKSVELRRHTTHGGIALNGRRETANLVQLLWL